MKKYLCPRCGKKLLGRVDYCPRCAQHIVYEKGGHYFDSLNNEYDYDAEKKTIKLRKTNDKAPK